MMKSVTFGLALATIGSAAFAQERASTLTMTCGQAQGLVVSQGAIVLSTGANTYDRYVRDQSFCYTDQVTKPDFVRTREAGGCALLRCFERTPFNDR